MNRKVLLTGAGGRMGNAVLQALNGINDLECVGKIDITFTTDENKTEYSAINDFKGKADIIIDFSNHAAIGALLDYALKNGTPIIIATTGHDAAEKEQIKAASEKIAVFYSGNMSIGIAILSNLVREAVAAMPNSDVEIVETHHNRKIDAPSGTAIMLFDSVKEVRQDAVAVMGRSGLCKREKNEVGINSLRYGNIVGIHEVIISSDNESITLKHQAYDRKLFADGAVRVAQYLIGKQAGLYNMKDFLKNG